MEAFIPTDFSKEGTDLIYVTNQESMHSVSCWNLSLGLRIAILF